MARLYWNWNDRDDDLQRPGRALIWRALKGTLPAWCVLALALGATVVVWHVAQSAASNEARQRFEAEVRAVQMDLRDRLRTYEQVLRGGVSVFYSWPPVSREDWRSYVEHLHIAENYPGIQGIGFAPLIAPADLDAHVRAVRASGFPDYRVWPEYDRPVYTSVIYLEPFDWRNQRAFGFDMFQEPVRRAAMERARDTGETSLSGKVTLVQETDQRVQPGFLMYLPVYRTPSPAHTAERRRQLTGYVYSPFRMHDFMRGLLGDRERRVTLQIFDGTDPHEAALMYTGGESETPAAAAAPFTATVPMELAGRNWTLRFAALPALAPDRTRPLLLAAGALMVSLLLWAIVWSLARNRARAAAANRRLQADIEARERTERRLRDAETSFRYLFEKNPNAMWVFDRESLLILAANDAATALYGYSSEEFRQIRITELRPAEDVPRLLAYQADRPPGLRSAGEWRHLTKAGELIDVEIVSYTLEFQQRPATLVVARDVTEKKQAEAQLRQAQKMEAVGQLSGGIAHDFNNLLTVIIGNLENAQVQMFDRPQARDSIAEALTAAEKGGALAHRLLAFSRQQILQPVPTDLNQVVTGMLELLRRAVGESIEIDVNLHDELWPALVDQGQVESSLLNLTLNARDAMPAGGRLTIESANVTLDAGYAADDPEVDPGDYVLLSITDTGAGMSPEIVARACEPFFTTKGIGKGSGLGLSMIYGFARQSRGHLKISSEVGHGTTIELYLPRATSVRPRSSTPGAAETDAQGSETILVVEDEEALRELVVGTLKNFGYRVLEAADGDQAVARLQEGQEIDLLFTDVGLPGALSGPQVAEEARRLRPEIRVLFTSGYTQNATAACDWFDAGAQLLNKPYRRQELSRRIREMLDSPL